MLSQPLRPVLPPPWNRVDFVDRYTRPFSTAELFAPFPFDKDSGKGLSPCRATFRRWRRCGTETPRAMSAAAGGFRASALQPFPRPPRLGQKTPPGRRENPRPLAGGKTEHTAVDLVCWENPRTRSCFGRTLKNGCAGRASARGARAAARPARRVGGLGRLPRSA
jgi:hypothetical protein